jgi:alcohol dehydrogenase
MVIGGGSVGLLGALILKFWGVESLQVAETNPLRRQSVAEAGLEAFDPLARPMAESAFDLILDAVGATATRKASVAAIAPGGVIAHVGLQDWAGDFDARRVTLSEVTFIGAYTYTEDDLSASLKALADGNLGSLDWIERRPLGDGDAAFHDLSAGRSGAAKIVLIP